MIRSQLHLIGQPVRSLQTMLRTISFAYPFLPRLTPDGIFGERTLEAVMLFQREFFPPVTGQVNQATWDAIVSLYHQVVSRLTPLAHPAAFQVQSFPSHRVRPAFILTWCSPCSAWAVSGPERRGNL